MIDTLPVWIGWDSREEVAGDVCRHSLLKRSSVPLYVRFLKQEPLWEIGLYKRHWEWRAGQKVDLIDDRPFSTEFSFSRFLVPALQQYEGWALFCDCDFLFLADVAELLPYMDDSKAALACKQKHEPAETVKMDGQAQQRYHRKNWSSFVLWNCGHPSNKRLTVRAVNEEFGSWLHQFHWLADEEIGEIPPQWNWISGVTEGEPKAVHYTTGGPWFAGHESVRFAAEWHREYAAATSRKEAA